MINNSRGFFELKFTGFGCDGKYVVCSMNKNNSTQNETTVLATLRAECLCSLDL